MHFVLLEFFACLFVLLEVLVYMCVWYVFCTTELSTVNMCTVCVLCCRNLCHRMLHCMCTWYVICSGATGSSTVSVCACFLNRKFLIRQLCREYGIQAYMTLAKIAKREDLLDWIIVKEPTKKVHCAHIQSRGYIIIMLTTLQLM